MKDFYRKRQLLTSIFVLWMGAVWIAVSAAFFTPPSENQIPAPKEGFLAPEIALETLTGDFVVLSDLQEQAVLINFWTSWCPPCRIEMPAMQRIYETYKDQDFSILAINVTQQDSLEAASQFVSSHGLTFPILLDRDGKIAQKYQVSSFPTSFFVTKQGVISEALIGGPMAEALLESRVRQLIGEKP